MSRYLANGPYHIDRNRIGIWGDQYAGYVAAMTLATDHQHVFHCGAAVEPITAWQFYSALYTERMMGRLDDHREAYERASLVVRAANVSDHVLMLVHGRDPVGKQMSTTLALALERADVRFEHMVSGG